MAVVSIQGSMIGRNDKNGPQGDGVNENISFTLNTADRHAIAYGLDPASYNQGENAEYDFSIAEEKVQTAHPYLKGAYSHTKDGINEEYTVRRLTPTECARLQGFPDNWCSNLETVEPTQSTIDWWSGVFETYRKVIGNSTKIKSRNQIIKWLKNPCSDSAEYKMWGNGVALPCVCFVMRGIALVNNKYPVNY
ncbi:MAG: C-5 cytosine-specific DNA methylase [Firmicutes bacterium ADurb.Bin419]|nr:MAG: C-5 cytosine-specific DNA methylase [Firmicutes bacterium ADurb.Bin419]